MPIARRARQGMRRFGNWKGDFLRRGRCIVIVDSQKLVFADFWNVPQLIAQSDYIVRGYWALRLLLDFLGYKAAI
jgi:hypothetical protein